MESQLTSSGSSSGNFESARMRRPVDSWTAHGLPSNSSLSALPPLPTTPASSKSFQDPYLSLHRSRPFRELLDSATERTKTPAPISYTPKSAAKQFEPSYPVLSARQSNSNLARDVKYSARSGVRSPLAEMKWKSPARIPLPESPDLDVRSIRPTIPEVEVLASPTVAAPSGIAARTALPPSPETSFALPQTIAPRIETPSSSPSRSASFRLGKDFPDMTNLLDASMGFGRQSLGNETFDLDIAALRIKPASRPNTASAFASGSVMIKRTLPSSSSGGSLASVGEEKHLLDQSTLLPMSPIKTQDLLREMLSNESFLDEPSVYLPPPPSARKTPHRAHQGDVTIDIQTLMSKVRKPKRASGTEESFVDLLHDEPSMMLLADETFLPGSIRRDPRKAKSTPRLSSGGSPKTIGGQLASYPSTIKGSLANPLMDRQTAYSPSKTSPIKTLPDRQSAYTPARGTTMTIIRSSPPHTIPHRPAATTPSRHAYTPRPPGTALLPDRQMGYPTPSRTPRSAMQPALLVPDRQQAFASPAKLSFPSPAKRSNSPVAAISGETPRGHNTSATPRTTTRRISLSAGAVSVPSSARISRIDLPPPTPRAQASPSKRPSVRAEAARTPGKMSSGLPAKISAEIEAAKGHQRARSTGSALVATASQPNSTDGLPRPRSSVAPARGSAIPAPRSKESAPPTLDAARIRTGSTPAPVIARSEATTKELGRATISARSTTRPGLPVPSAPAARPAPVSTAARMDQIRSKIASTRTFGNDAAGKINSSGLPRPAAASAKPRGMSTPASAPARTTSSVESKLSKAATSIAPGAVRSALPRPITTSSRLPHSSASASTTKGSLPPSTSSAGLASIRERLDRLQARQQATRGTK